MSQRITIDQLRRAVERLSAELGEPLEIERAYGRYSITHKYSTVFGPAGTKSEKYDHAHVALEAVRWMKRKAEGNE